MTSGDFLNYVTAISIIIIIGFISYLLYNFIITVRKVNILFETITKDIKKIEEKIKNFFKKGGGKNMARMKMEDNKKQNGQYSEKGPNPVLVGSVGAIAGAAIGAATATALSNKKTRERVGETISNLREQAMETIGAFSEGARSMKEETTRRISSGIKGGKSRGRRKK